MFSKSLMYFRLQKGYSKKELAAKVGLDPSAITLYENGKRIPTMENIKALAAALDIYVSDFLHDFSDGLNISHAEFRKSSKLSKTRQKYLQMTVENYLNRFYNIVDILGDFVLPDCPAISKMELTMDPELDAVHMREALGVAQVGPVLDLTGYLENLGFIMIGLDVNEEAFSGLNGCVNNRPYIAFNKLMSPERIRSTIAHELAHCLFTWNKDMTESEVEKYATAISGAFLLPEKDLIREAGIKRSRFTNDLILICKKYGVSSYLLCKRMELAGIISGAEAKRFYIAASIKGWNKYEPSRIQPELPSVFTKLVYRAVSEGDISIQKGTELLQIPFDVVDRETNALLVS